MEGKSRFTIRQVNKALRLLRELPVKDGRKSIQETLRLLEQGMREALGKGYSRGEIRHTIAGAEVVVSATTLKGFLAEELKEAGQKQEDTADREAEKIGRHSEQKTDGTAEKNTEDKAGEKAGSSLIDSENMADRPQSQASKTATIEEISQSGRDEQTASDTRNSSRKERDVLAGEHQPSGPKQHEKLAGKTSPGSIVIKPDTPKEDL